MQVGLISKINNDVVLICETTLPFGKGMLEKLVITPSRSPLLSNPLPAIIPPSHQNVVEQPWEKTRPFAATLRAVSLDFDSARRILADDCNRNLTQFPKKTSFRASYIVIAALDDI